MNHHKECPTCGRARGCDLWFCDCREAPSADDHSYDPKHYLCGCMTCCECKSTTAPECMNVDELGDNFYCDKCSHLYDNHGIRREIHP